MSDQATLQRLRQFLLGVVAFIFIGSVFELILLEHYEETLQWVPFITSSIGFLSVVTVWSYPGNTSIKSLRLIMIGISVVSLWGMYLHFIGNLEFTREINPSFTLRESIWPAMKGSSPLLAPGILFLAGILGIAATYKHPATDEL